MERSIIYSSQDATAEVEATDEGGVLITITEPDGKLRARMTFSAGDALDLIDAINAVLDEYQEASS